MAFATVEDVATYLTKDLDAADAATVALTLDVATEMIRKYTGQTISQVTNDVIDVNVYGKALVLLPEVPVTAVSITDDGLALVADDFDWSRAGVIKRYGARFSRDVSITYTHGYATIPDDIQGICIEMAKRAFENPAGLQREDLNTASQWLGLTPENKAILDRYRMAP